MSEKPDEAVEMAEVPNIAHGEVNENKETGSAACFNGEVEYLEPPVKSDRDDGLYRILKLPNDLTILLISRPTDASADDGGSGKCDGSQGDNEKATSSSGALTKKTDDGTSGIVKCSLTVNVGCLSDAAENPCIAALLSRVVLTASKKYPMPFDFVKFLKMQHCDLNVSGQPEATIFSFSTQEIHLRETLDRFINCFVEPLLKPEIVHIKKKQIQRFGLNEPYVPREFADPECLRAKDYLFATLASKCNDNPASHLVPGRFKVACSKSTDTLHKEIEKFMERHYSAHRMVASLEGQLSIEDLEEYAKTYFSQIPSNGLPPIDFTRFSFDKCFDSPEFRMIYEVQGSCELLDHRLELHWSMPSPMRLHRSKPTKHLSWILNRRGKGSLLWYLRQKNWCKELYCADENTCLEPNSIFSLFTISLTVTDEGHKNYKKILDAVYSYINLMRSEGAHQKFYEQFRKALHSELQRYDPAFWSACNLKFTAAMRHSASADDRNERTVLLEYDPAALKQCLEHMSPEKANIIVCQKKFGTRHCLSEKWEEVHDRVENVKYRKSTIPEAWIKRWKNVEPLPQFKLPEVGDATILGPEVSPKYPVKIRCDELCEVYHLDTEFQSHSNAVNYLFCTAVPRESAENAFMLDVFVILLERAADKELRQGAYSGFDFSVTPQDSGLLVHVTGHNNNTLRLMEIIAKHAASLANDVTERVFTDMQTYLAIIYLGVMLKSEALASGVKNRVLLRGDWLASEKYASGMADFEKFQHFAQHFFDRTFVKCLAQGNFKEPEVLENVERCIQTLKCRPLLPNSPIPQTSSYELLPGTHCCQFQSTDADDYTMVINHYQFTERSIDQYAMNGFLYRTMIAPELNSLRARKNLDDYKMQLDRDGITYGYFLRTMKFPEDTNIGVAKIDETIESFREAMNKWFESLTTMELKKVKTACKRMLASSSMSFDELLGSNWHEIATGQYIFNRTAPYLTVLNELSIEEFRRSMMHLTSNDSGIRKLSIQAVSRKEYAEVSAARDPLQTNFLTNLPGEDVKPRDYYITDIAAYTRRLNPILKDRYTS